MIAGDRSQAGLRLPLGLSYLMNQTYRIFAEIVPVVRFAPDTGGDVDGGIGVRYYFLTSSKIHAVTAGSCGSDCRRHFGNSVRITGFSHRHI